MTKDQYDHLSPELQALAEILLQMLAELKGINRSVQVELENTNEPPSLKVS